MAVAWLALLAVLAAEPALDQRPSVVVHSDVCLELDADQAAALRATVEHELGAGVEHHGGAGQRSDTQLLIGCVDSDGRAQLRVIDPIAETAATRIVAMPEREARPLALGRAGAALVRSAWMTLALAPRPAQPVQRRARRIARRPVAPWELVDSFVVRSYLGSGAPALMLGEQVEMVHRPLRHLAWKADGELAYWRVPVDGGRVNTLTVSVGPALLGYGEIRSRRRRGTVAIYGGAGARVGGVRMGGRNPQGRDSVEFEPFAGPMALARASVSLGRYVSLSASAELGWVLLGPREPGGLPLTLRGPWVAGSLGIVSAF